MTESSIRLINGFIETELQAIKEAYVSKNLEGKHIEASQAIAWACYIFKDWVGEEVSNKLTEFGTDLKGDKHSNGLWLSSLLAASYILKEDGKLRDRLLVQISHGKSTLRAKIISAVTFMVLQLSFSNEYLRQAVITNIKRSHGYYQESAVISLHKWQRR